MWGQAAGGPCPLRYTRAAGRCLVFGAQRDGLELVGALLNCPEWFDEAARLIPKIEKAISAYPYSKPGGYRIWPGPNSNTFVAHVLRSVPELGVVLPPDAVGRDYLPEGKLFAVDPDGRDVHATLYGLLGVSAGVRSGIELHIMGLVAGIDLARPGIKIPALGRIGI